MAGKRRVDRLKSTDRVVVILGAGATAACGGPLTGEILPRAFRRADPLLLQSLVGFLERNFGLPKRRRRNDGDYPQLPLLLSLLDTAIDREHGFGGSTTVDQLRRVRKEAEYAVFHAIADSLRHAVGPDPHERLFGWIHRVTARQPTVISLNYDLLADQALIAMENGGYPDYACEIETPGYAEAKHWGTLLKIHGSMNWLYCSACDRLELGIDKQGRTSKVALDAAAKLLEKRAHDLTAYYESRSKAAQKWRCPRCGGGFRPVMITPTHLKDYRNPHIAALWYRAERELQECTRVIFIGYSLPWDDVDVIYLLKRGLMRRPGESMPRITVVERPPGEPGRGRSARPRRPARPVRIDEHDAGRRYLAVFGRQIDWHPVGFKAWLQSVAA